jgi:hypothetical protein
MTIITMTVWLAVYLSVYLSIEVPICTYRVLAPHLFARRTYN